MNGIYLTEQGKQEIEAKIAELEQERESLSCSEMDDVFVQKVKHQSHLYGKIVILRELLESATILPVEKKMNKVKLTIGDWSRDGHNRYEVFVYDSNKTVEEIRQAYKDSCKLTGISFNHNEDYTGLNLTWVDPEYSSRQIAVEYGDSDISGLAKEILDRFKVDYSKYYDDDFDVVDGFIELLINFIKLSLPDLELKETSFKKSELETIDPINGWWNDSLNCGFGYGLFD